MSHRIEPVFWDTPELSTKVYAYCNSIPEYVQAEEDYETMLQNLKEELGYGRMQEIEDCFIHYLARSVQAYYLFGLGLRQEILWALGRE